MSIRYWRPFVTSAPLSCHAGSRGPMRMRTNVVYFRVMRRLYRREWYWLCMNQHPWQRTRGHGVWRLTSIAHDLISFQDPPRCFAMCHTTFNADKWKPSLFNVILAITSWIYSKIIVGKPLWTNVYRDLNHSFGSGFHYSERGFPFQNEVIPIAWLQKRVISTPNEVIPILIPKGVHFHSYTFRKYISYVKKYAYPPGEEWQEYYSCSHDSFAASFKQIDGISWPGFPGNISARCTAASLCVHPHTLSCRRDSCGSDR